MTTGFSRTPQAPRTCPACQKLIESPQRSQVVHAGEQCQLWLKRQQYERRKKRQARLRAKLGIAA